MAPALLPLLVSSKESTATTDTPETIWIAVSVGRGLAGSLSDARRTPVPITAGARWRAGSPPPPELQAARTRPRSTGTVARTRVLYHRPRARWWHPWRDLEKPYY